MKRSLLFFALFFSLFAAAGAVRAQDGNTNESRQTRAGRFDILKSEQGKFYFVLRSSNGREILKGYFFNSEDKVKDAIANVRQQAADDANFDARSETQWYFFLKGKDGKAIGRSENYTTEAAMKRGIESVKRTAPDALIKTDKN
jgi:uncharacterized protein YegP (UPF0339 family)